MSFSIVLLAFALFLAGLLLWRAMRQPGPSHNPGVATAEPIARHIARWRMAGVVAGLLAAVAVARFGSLGVGPLLAAPAFGLARLLAPSSVSSPPRVLGL
jgi:hypothetical protein